MGPVVGIEERPENVCTVEVEVGSFVSGRDGGGESSAVRCMVAGNV